MKFPFSSYSVSIGLVRWKRNICPFELIATPAASPATIPLGNLKKFATTRYGSSGTAWNGVVFDDGDSIGVDCAPARHATSVRQARTTFMDLFILFKRRSRPKIDQSQGHVSVE